MKEQIKQAIRAEVHAELANGTEATAEVSDSSTRGGQEVPFSHSGAGRTVKKIGPKTGAVGIQAGKAAKYSSGHSAAGQLADIFQR